MPEISGNKAIRGRSRSDGHPRIALLPDISGINDIDMREGGENGLTEQLKERPETQIAKQVPCVARKYF